MKKIWKTFYIKITHLVFRLRSIKHTSGLFPGVYDYTYDSTWSKE